MDTQTYLEALAGITLIIGVTIQYVLDIILIMYLRRLHKDSK